MIDKRGSSAVFLCVIAAAVISISLTLVYAAHWKAIDSYSKGLACLSADSVLSEFDRYVLKDYGLFLLRGNDSSLSCKFRDYMSFSLDVPDGADLEKASVSSARFSVIDLHNVRDQIKTYVKTVGIADIAANHGEPDGDSGSGGDTQQRQKHTLRHGPTIVSLPSRQLPDKNIVTKVESAVSGIKDPESILKNGADKYLTDTYIMAKFNRDRAVSSDEHFFTNEVEYIIAGKLSDEENIKRTDLALKALRFPTNLAHIYADPEKWSAVVTAAETITPGLLGTVTQAGIASVWAAAESVNDVKLLHEGYRVPIVKDAASWAIDIDGLLNKNTDKLFKPDVNKGRMYDDYLRILLFIEDNDMKTARILDLIQINMRKNYDSDFMIQECATGIAVDAAVRGISYSFDRTY